MQDYITEEALEDIGIELDGQDVGALLDSLNEAVEERVGTEITDSLDEAKLKELLDLQENGTDEQLGEWLTANVPDLQEIIDDNIDIVIGELAEDADEADKADGIDIDEDAAV